MKNSGLIGPNIVHYICLACASEEGISKDIVDVLDLMDVESNPFEAPQFKCKYCGGEMYPEFYENALGYQFRIEEVKQ